MKRILLLAIFSVYLVAVGLAQQRIVSATSGNWFDSDTWNPQVVPGSYDTVIIQSGHTVEMKNTNWRGFVIASDVTVAKLKVQSGGKLSIYEGERGWNTTSHLTVTDSLIIDGSIEGDLTQTSSGLFVAFILHHQGRYLGGSGLMKYGEYNAENGQNTILPGSDLNFYYLLTLIPDDDSIINYGSITTDQRIIGAGSKSTWINMENSFLSVGDSMLDQGRLIANATGNTVQYTALYRNIPAKTPFIDGTYYNLNIASIDTVDLDSNIIVLNDFNFKSGSFQPHDDTITIYGDWYQYGDFIDDSSRVIFAGTEPQYIIGSSVANFYNLQVDNSSALILQSDVQVKDTLTLNSIIKCGTNKLILGEDATNTGLLDYKSGKIIGKFARWIKSSANPYFYPIGTVEYNTFVNITFPALDKGGLVGFQFISDYPGTNGFPLQDADGLKFYNPLSEGYWVADTSEGFSLGNNQYLISLKGEAFTSFAFNDSTSIAIRPHVDSTWRLQGDRETSDAANYTATRSALDSFPRHFALIDTTNCQAPLLTGINGLTDVCRGDTGVLYIAQPTSDDNQFYWTVDAGTIRAINAKSTVNNDSIKIDWQDEGQIATISVYAKNSCTFGNTVTLTVNVNSVPPQELYGLKAVPENSSSVLYYIDKMPGYSYTWYTSANATVDSTTTDNDTAYVSFTVPGTDTIFIIAQSPGGCKSDTANFPIFVYDVINSVNSGYWYDASIWDCSCVPQISDNVRINNPHTVTLESYYDGKITVYDFDVNNLVIENGGTLTRTDASISVQGDLIVDGLIDFSDYYLQLYNNDKVLGGIGQIIVDSMIVPGSRTVVSGSDLTVNGDVVLDDSYMLNNGKLTVNGDIEGSSASTFENGYNSTLNITDSLLVASGSLVSDTTGNTVVYCGSSDQYITPQATSSNGYYNLSLASQGTKILKGDITILGDLKILDTASFDGQSYNITLYGDWYDLSVASDPFVERTSTVLFDASGTQYIYSPYVETFYNLKIGQNSTLEVPPKQFITVSNSFYLDGLLKLSFTSKHDTLPSFIYDNDIIYGTNGKVETDLLIDAKTWHEVSPAIQGLTSDVFTKANGVYNPNLYEYDETVDLNNDPTTEPAGAFDQSLLGWGWKTVQPDANTVEPLYLNRCYFFYDDKNYTLAMSGQVAKVTVNFDSTLSYTNNDPDDDNDTLPNLYDGWNGLGNPYIAYLSIDSLINNAVNVDSGVFVWDNDSGQYAGYLKGYRVLSGRLGAYIPPLQGFVVRADTTGASIKIRPEYRVHAQQMYLKGDNKYKKNAVKLAFSANGRTEYFATYFYPGATEGYDGGFDLIHLKPTFDKFPEFPYIYTKAKGVDLALDGLPESDMDNTVLPIYVETGVNGTYTIKTEYIKGLYDQAVLLKDLKTGKTILLRSGTTYAFDYNTEDDPHRFDLYIIRDNAPQIVRKIQDQTAYEDKKFVLPLNKIFADPDNFDTLRLSVQSSAQWLKLANDTLYGTPSQNDVGNVQVTVIASDILNKTAQQTFNINVLNTNDPPQAITSLADLEDMVGEKLVVMLPEKMFTDPDPQDKLTISIENLPQWLRFDAQNMEISGIPSNQDIGTYTISVKATDQSGASSTIDFKVKVLPNPQFNGSDLSIYPNPANDIINVALAANIQTAEIEIYGTDGRLFKKQQINSNQAQVNLKGLPQGTYILRFITDGKTYTSTFTKN